jgi:Autotransporter beta-domain
MRFKYSSSKRKTAFRSKCFSTAFKKTTFVVGSCLILPTALHAACNTLFQADVTTAGTSQQYCFSSVDELYSTAIRDAGISFPGYTSTSQLTSTINLMGVGATVSYPQSSDTVTLSIPELGINESFTGATRRDSAILLRQYLENNPDLLGRIQRRNAALSPLSPITGVGGVMPRAIMSDFTASFGDTPTRIATSQGSASQGAQSVLGAGVVLSSQSVLGAKVKTLAIPLSYTVRNDIDPRRQALLRASIGVTDTAGSRSFQGRVSAGYRFPMSDNWVLTPMAGISLAGSKDAGYAIGVLNGSLASTYTWEFESFDVTMGNMFGYYQSFKPPIRYAADPKIRLLALVNGAFITQPIMVGERRMSIEYGFSDTRLGGTEVYQKNSQELSISLGTNKNALSARSFFRATLAFQRAKDSKGATLSVNYWF